MRRPEFLGVFLGYVTKKAPQWLPEEGLEEDMLDIIVKRLSEHSLDIRDILKEHSKRIEEGGKK